MHLSIKDENDTFCFNMEDVDHNDSIAHVKALYQNSGKCTPTAKHIVLMYKGKELQDELTLGEQGIGDKSILIHIESSNEPYHTINYKDVAENINAKRHLQKEAMKRMQHEDIWTTDEHGACHSLGETKSLIRSPPISSPLKGGQNKTVRSFFNEVSVSVMGSIFHVLPRMEGRWNGEVATVPSTEEGPQVISDELYFREADGFWSQRQSTTSILGMSSTSHCWLKPVADGILKAETDDVSLRNCDITLREQGMHILLVTAISKTTNNVVLVETITLIDTARRVRTVQRFAENGDIRFVLVMTENRVLDVVSGAMEKFSDL